MGFADCFQKLRELGLKRTEPDPTPTKLRLSEITRAPEVFQPRSNLGGLVEETHVIDLMGALENEPSGFLDPVAVWWSGERWILVDGHHRYEAYRRHYAQSESFHQLTVPVYVVSGDVSDALTASISENSKARLGLDKNDKFDTAWRLVCAGERNRNKIAPRCGIGSSTVQAMMTRLQAIRDDDPAIDVDALAEQGWAYARDLGKVQRVIDDQWVDKLAGTWARRLAKEFGAKLRDNPDALFKALLIYSTPMTLDLYSRMENHFGSDSDEESDY
jgi:hypothetical protein